MMPFGLTNASTTFYNLMNDVPYEFLDAFVMVYFNALLSIARP